MEVKTTDESLWIIANTKYLRANPYPKKFLYRADIWFLNPLPFYTISVFLNLKSYTMLPNKSPLISMLLLLPLLSFTPKADQVKTVNYCTYAVYNIIDNQTGYIVIQGEEITGQVEGVDYNCLSVPRSICTITTRCETVLQISWDEFHIPKSGDYSAQPGQYQP